ncbi:Rpn family recombination-promoting nuclease/putative transposase [Massilia violaceinigra]|uniref:Rpn family recombination-promoting nuclease/putative transposase n=1 Tax=Massilia violaceinigra TaxID=2045208 RepID=A0ABY4ADD5_9BURK|nr:Rpn family recombination-promoting nuclease/putative transposase [Massilia violaceinigra]
MPPVRPLVFYNGAPRWSAPLDLTELLMVPPAGLAPLQPSQRYTLIDQQRLDRAALEANGDLLALLFRIELSVFSDVLTTHVPLLKTWFRSTPLTSLRTSVWAWWKALLARRNDDIQLINLDTAEESDMDIDIDKELEKDMERLARLSWPEQVKHGVYDVALKQLKREKETIIEKATAEGKAVGIADGQVIALRKMVGALLHKRFGDLPAPVAQCIAQAAKDDLELWFERSLDAPTLAAVFADDKTPG